MQTKLTLRLDSDLIERAKRYAEKRGTSVSKIVADFFQAVTAVREDVEEDEAWEGTLGPLTRQLVNRPPAPPIDEDAYYRYLEQKHLGGTPLRTGDQGGEA